MLRYLQKLKKPWDKLTMMQKRVIIAKDVIAAIHAKRLEATTRYYIDTYQIDQVIPNNWGTIIKKELPSAQENLKSIKHCPVCAKGACFVTAIDRLNNVSNEVVLKFALSGSVEVPDLLKDVFDYQTWNMIEIAFEKNDDREWLGNYTLARQCIEFGNNFYNPEDRMLAIMQNIIDNKGVFDPTQEYVIVED